MLIKARLRFPEIFFGLLLAVGIFAMGAAFWSSQHSNPAAESQSPEKRAEDKGLWNWLVHDAAGFFTLWLVIVGAGQLVLFYVQLKLIRESLVDAQKAADAAQDAADAAKLNAQAVIDSERARIFIHIDQDTTDSIRAAAKYVNSPQMDDGTITTNVGLFYGLKNYGKTPAIIKEISHQMILAPELPKERDYVPVIPLPFDHILGAGERTEESTLACSLGYKMIVADAKKIEALENAVWFYGYVSYDDTFGWGRELRYVFQYDGSIGGRFRLSFYREIQSAKRHEQ